MISATEVIYCRIMLHSYFENSNLGWFKQNIQDNEGLHEVKSIMNKYCPQLLENNMDNFWGAHFWHTLQEIAERVRACKNR